MPYNGQEIFAPEYFDPENYTGSSVPVWKRLAAGFGSGFNQYHNQTNPTLQLYKDYYGTNSIEANQRGVSSFVNDHFPVGFVEDSLEQQGFASSLLNNMVVGFGFQKPPRIESSGEWDRIMRENQPANPTQGTNCKYDSDFGLICERDGRWYNQQGQEVLRSDDSTLGGTMIDPSAGLNKSNEVIGGKWWMIVIAAVIILVGISVIK